MTLKAYDRIQELKKEIQQKKDDSDKLVSNEIKKLENKIDKILELLTSGKLNSQQVIVKHSSSMIEEKVKKYQVDDGPGYIPNIDTEGMDIRTSNKSKKIKINDLDEGLEGVE